VPILRRFIDLGKRAVTGCVVESKRLVIGMWRESDMRIRFLERLWWKKHHGRYTVLLLLLSMVFVVLPCLPITFQRTWVRDIVFTAILLSASSRWADSGARSRSPYCSGWACWSRRG
jgi:hypothetical protein